MITLAQAEGCRPAWIDAISLYTGTIGADFILHVICVSCLPCCTFNANADRCILD